MPEQVIDGRFLMPMLGGMITRSCEIAVGDCEEFVQAFSSKTHQTLHDHRTHMIANAQWKHVIVPGFTSLQFGSKNYPGAFFDLGRLPVQDKACLTTHDALRGHSSIVEMKPRRRDT